jgi:hypothetical protein
MTDHTDDDIDDISIDTWVNQWNRGLSVILVVQPDAPGTPFEFTISRVICIMTVLFNAFDDPTLSDKQREFRAGLRRDIEEWAPVLIPAYLKKQAEHELNEARKRLKQGKAMTKRHRRPKA